MHASSHRVLVASVAASTLLLSACGPRAAAPTRPRDHRAGWLSDIGRVAPDTDLRITIASGPLPLRDMAFSPDGKRLALATGGDQLLIVDVEAGRIDRWIPSGFPASSAVAWSPDGKLIAVTGISASPAVAAARLFDASTGAEVIAFPARPEGALDIAWVDSRSVVVPAPFGPAPLMLLTVDGTDTDRVVPWLDGCNAPTRVAIAADGTAVSDCTRIDDKGGIVQEVVLFADPGVKRIASGPVLELRVGGEAPGTLAVASADGFVRLYDLTGVSIASAAHRSPVRTVDLHPSGKIIATGADDGLVRIWGVPCSESYVAVNAVLGPPERVRFCPDGSCLVVAGARGAATGRLAIWRKPKADDAPAESVKK